MVNRRGFYQAVIISCALWHHADAIRAEESTDQSARISISGQTLSISRDYIVSIQPNAQRPQVHIWISFSIPGWHPLGSLAGTDPHTRNVVESKRREDAQRRGEAIINLRLEVDDGRGPTIEKGEAACRMIGTSAKFQAIKLLGISGYSCSLMEGSAIYSYFPIQARSGNALLYCKFRSEGSQGTPVDDCQLIANNRPDKIRRILYVSRESISRLPQWLDAVDELVAKMKTSQ